MEKEWVSVFEAAEMLGISRMSVDRAWNQNRLCGCCLLANKPSGYGRVLISAASIQAGIQQRSGPGPEWISFEEASRLTGLSTGCLWKRVQNGELTVRRTDIPLGKRDPWVFLVRSEVERTRPSSWIPSGPAFEEHPDTEWAYLAGIIDGEASVCIARGKGRKTCQYTLRIDVANTNRDLIEWLVRTFGGWEYRSQRTQITWRPIWTWVTAAGTAAHILRKTLPYLVVKRQPAELCIEFQQHIDHWKYQVNTLPPGEIEWREKQKQAVSALRTRFNGPIDRNQAA